MERIEVRQLNGRVLVNDEPTNSRLYRFCEKQIDHWIRKAIESGTGVTPEDLNDTEFTVEFTDETDGVPGQKQISCVTEVTIRGAHWKGCDLAADNQEAFLHALKHMQAH
jgi:hypothetical protein